MKTDYLYHLNIDVTDTQNTSDIQQRFGDIKVSRLCEPFRVMYSTPPPASQVICAGGTAQRMRDLAIYLQPIFGITGKPVDLCESGHRYAVFKVGQVLCVSHGVGSSTFSVVLHELLKLVRYAKCKDPVFVRIGTCGGLGIEPGTVVVSKDAYNGYLENVHEIVSIPITWNCQIVFNFNFKEIQNNKSI